MASIIKVDQIQSDSGTVNVSSNLQFSTSFSLNTPTINSPLMSNGIRFPATQVSSADANTLDDYEEGTWTPYFYAPSFTVSSYNTQVGRYVKIGSVCTVHCRLIVNTVSGGSSNTIAIYGLPFTVETTENYMVPAIEQYSWTNWPANMYSISGLAIGNTQYINLLHNGTTGSRAGVPSNCVQSGATGISLSLSYIVA